VFAAIEKLGGGKAVYIGDSEVDIETANNAGLPCISVCWGFKSEEFLIAHGAEICVHSPEEIF
jgi:phosphoglycolate phosphatase